jgi:hypothetical protein
MANSKITTSRDLKRKQAKETFWAEEIPLRTPLKSSPRIRDLTKDDTRSAEPSTACSAAAKHWVLMAEMFNKLTLVMISQPSESFPGL